MSRSRWLSQFTTEEYEELLILNDIQPLGCDRDYLYAAMMIAAQGAIGGTKIDIEELLFDTTEADRWKRFLAFLKQKQEEKARTDGPDSDLGY